MTDELERLGDEAARAPIGGLPAMSQIVTRATQKRRRRRAGIAAAIVAPLFVLGGAVISAGGDAEPDVIIDDVVGQPDPPNTSSERNDEGELSGDEISEQSGEAFDSGFPFGRRIVHAIEVGDDAVVAVWLPAKLGIEADEIDVRLGFCGTGSDDYFDGGHEWEALDGEFRICSVNKGIEIRVPALVVAELDGERVTLDFLQAREGLEIRYVDEVQPTVVGSILVVGDGVDGPRVRGYEVGSWEPLWEIEIDQPDWEAPGHGTASVWTANSDRLVVSSSFGPVTGIDGRDGRIAWQLDLDTYGDLGESIAAVAVSTDGATIYLASSFASEGDNRPPQVREIRMETGAVIWKSALSEGSDHLWAVPTITEDLVLLADAADHQGGFPGPHLHALDRNTGAPVWEFDLESTFPGFHSVPVLADDSRAYVMNSDRTVFAVDLVTGEERWRLAGVGAFDATWEVTDGLLQVGSVCFVASSGLAAPCSVPKDEVEPAPPAAPQPPAEARGTIAVRLVEIEGFFIEGFELGLRFETGDGQVIEALLWSDFVVSLGSSDLEARYDSVFELDVPAGDVVLLSTGSIGNGPPPARPDVHGDLDCRLDITVAADQRIDVLAGFGSDCPTLG